MRSYEGRHVKGQGPYARSRETSWEGSGVIYRSCERRGGHIFKKIYSLIPVNDLKSKNFELMKYKSLIFCHFET